MVKHLETYPSRKEIIEWIELFPLDSDFKNDQMLTGAMLLKAKMALALK